MARKRITKEDNQIKLDPAYVKHSVASKLDMKVWWLEELEGEILEFAKYVKNHYGIKYNDTAKAHLKRIGKTSQTLRMTSAMALGVLEDLHKYEDK
tara:strand:+ start:6752 stop:7039 length:288 start_codon:yes stop_codon:yes gene_type:complete